MGHQNHHPGEVSLSSIMAYRIALHVLIVPQPMTEGIHTAIAGMGDFQDAVQDLTGQRPVDPQRTNARVDQVDRWLKTHGAAPTGDQPEQPA
jgi:hypothetical protein